jgi:predicted transcriptional regulator
MRRDVAMSDRVGVLSEKDLDDLVEAAEAVQNEASQEGAVIDPEYVKAIKRLTAELEEIWDSLRHDGAER